jgi:Amt family ammonium transporter
MTPMFSGHFNNAAVAAFSTVAATCAGVVVWLLVEKVRDGHPTTLGGSSGAIAALVAITPSCAPSARSR